MAPSEVQEEAIEVTPAMMEAGAPVLLEFHREYSGSTQEEVAKIYRAMVLASPHHAMRHEK